MSRCTACDVGIEGEWGQCPLCGSAVTGVPSPSPIPNVPLQFSRRRILTVLFLVSLGVILASFVVQLLFRHGDAGVGVLRSIWLGVVAMWLVVLMAVRKRRNVAKGTLYLLVLVGSVCVYWDYLTGWHGWSLTYAVPIMCAFAIVALVITVRIMRTDIGEYIVYSVLTVLLGLAPIVFLALDWVGTPIPSVICIALSVMALPLHVSRARHIRHELAKRFHL
ncbi:DUF6320 domain-containing protein [Leucobacter tardus]|uniref:Uncharacterized protein n=1 Tax=Leucobacter tardus TaxID=501483 RepID=A0A939QJ54_9MICO|nr:DUF6320 domain-containing protein [Leucobacter tardus]MBO2988866.1 hypothetical protein [Leucobacter tardus]